MSGGLWVLTLENGPEWTPEYLAFPLPPPRELIINPPAPVTITIVEPRRTWGGIPTGRDAFHRTLRIGARFRLQKKDDESKTAEYRFMDMIAD